MERWEYAAGYQTTSDEWRVFDSPGTFEHASAKLRALELESRGDGWATNPCVVKRSDRRPQWQPVHDHAAELLAEVLTDIALRFASNGNDIMQGKDLNRVIKHVAFGLRPTQTEEYDS